MGLGFRGLGVGAWGVLKIDTRVRKTVCMSSPSTERFACRDNGQKHLTACIPQPDNVNSEITSEARILWAFGLMPCAAGSWGYSDRHGLCLGSYVQDRYERNGF